MWWCAYEDGTVWPCEVKRASVFGVTITPLSPAPDAGHEKTVNRTAVYDSDFNHP